MTATICELYRYPVKGLSAEPLQAITVETGCCIPHDRRFALARKHSLFDPENPAHIPKTNFFMLMQDERLAELETGFNSATGHFRVARNRRPLLEAHLDEIDGKASVERFFTEFLASPDGPARLVEAPGHTFSDARRRPNAQTGQYISIVNLASIAALGEKIGCELNPLRFRANVYISGLPAWEELDWVHQHFSLGEALVHVVSPITRCAATAVNPVTARRDINIPHELVRHFSHNHMGIYVEVIQGGKIAVGDSIRPSSPEETSSPGSSESL